MGKLYLVATPIGNLEDISMRALRVLREVALIAAEDTRHTGKLLAHFEIDTPLISYHEHSQSERDEELLERLERDDIALVSDAGSPLISDPGFELIREATQRGIQVIPIPGPSAVIAALSASGLPTDTFVFLGYLPRKNADRRRRLEQHRNTTHTLVFFEVPHRVQAALADLALVFGTDRPAAVCRELTKLHEQITRGPLGELQTELEATKPRGEYTLVIGGAQGLEPWTEQEVRAALADRISHGDSPSEAARWVAAQSGWSRRSIYRFTLEEE